VLSAGVFFAYNKRTVQTVLLLKYIYFKNKSIKIPPTITKAKAAKMYRKITMTINFKTRYM